MPSKAYQEGWSDLRTFQDDFDSATLQSVPGEEQEVNAAMVEVPEVTSKKVDERTKRTELSKSERNYIRAERIEYKLNGKLVTVDNVEC